MKTTSLKIAKTTRYLVLELTRPKKGPGLRYKRTSIIQGGEEKRGYHGSEELQWATPEDQKEIEGKKKKK